MKYQYKNRHFWCKGYYVSTVGADKEIIQKYIWNQLEEDLITDRITLKEHKDPFSEKK